MSNHEDVMYERIADLNPLDIMSTVEEMVVEDPRITVYAGDVSKDQMAIMALEQLLRDESGLDSPVAEPTEIAVKGLNAMLRRVTSTSQTYYCSVSEDMSSGKRDVRIGLSENVGIAC